jgi:metal-responsive CopG/Arc/MetJ family transcriptional regulator
MYNGSVRTTIELKPEHRAKLLELAARRGEKGFSTVIAEALQSYLESTAAKERLRKRALALRGTLPKAEADRLRQDTAALREFWR